LHLQNVPQDVYTQLEQMARAERRDVEEVSVHLLQQALQEQQRWKAHKEALEDLRRRRWTPPPGTPDSVELLREDRQR
jgi:hypothetical protein